MTSEPTTEPREAFVWVWLPGALEPVVAGRVDARREGVLFTYGRSYLANPDAIALYDPELPLRPGAIAPPMDQDVAGCLLDAGPDSWGQRIILDRVLAQRRRDADTGDLHPLTYLVQAGSDRIGALDFQASATEYVARTGATATLEELQQAADIVDRQEPLTDALASVLLRGTSIGGARPKALLDDGPRKLIAKFESSTDQYPVVQLEYCAMELARRCGIDVASVELTRVLGKHVLIVERFDRVAADEGWARRAFVSALTILGLPELLGRYATYHELARIVQERFVEPARTNRELFARIVFNVLCSNGDDHARNHGALWDGRSLQLSPAYDIAPGARGPASPQNQAMAVGPGRAESQVRSCIDHAALYGLSAGEARSIVEHQVDVLRREWRDVADLAGLTNAQRDRSWRAQFLNEYTLEGSGIRI